MLPPSAQALKELFEVLVHQVRVRGRARVLLLPPPPLRGAARALTGRRAVRRAAGWSLTVAPFACSPGAPRQVLYLRGLYARGAFERHGAYGCVAWRARAPVLRRYVEGVAADVGAAAAAGGAGEASVAVWEGAGGAGCDGARGSEAAAAAATEGAAERYVLRFDLGTGSAAPQQAELAEAFRAFVCRLQQRCAELAVPAQPSQRRWEVLVRARRAPGQAGQAGASSQAMMQWAALDSAQGAVQAPFVVEAVRSHQCALSGMRVQLHVERPEPVGGALAAARARPPRPPTKASKRPRESEPAVGAAAGSAGTSTAAAAVAMDAVCAAAVASDKSGAVDPEGPAVSPVPSSLDPSGVVASGSGNPMAALMTQRAPPEREIPPGGTPDFPPSLEW